MSLFVVFEVILLASIVTDLTFIKRIRSHSLKWKMAQMAYVLACMISGLLDTAVMGPGAGHQKFFTEFGLVVEKLPAPASSISLTFHH